MYTINIPEPLIMFAYLSLHQYKWLQNKMKFIIDFLKFKEWKSLLSKNFSNSLCQALFLGKVLRHYTSLVLVFAAVLQSTKILQWIVCWIEYLPRGKYLRLSSPHGILLQSAYFNLSSVNSTDAIVCIIILKIQIRFNSNKFNLFIICDKLQGLIINNWP